MEGEYRKKQYQKYLTIIFSKFQIVYLLQPWQNETLGALIYDTKMSISDGYSQI